MCESADDGMRFWKEGTKREIAISPGIERGLRIESGPQLIFVYNRNDVGGSAVVRHAEGPALLSFDAQSVCLADIRVLVLTPGEVTSAADVLRIGNTGAGPAVPEGTAVYLTATSNLSLECNTSGYGGANSSLRFEVAATADFPLQARITMDALGHVEFSGTEFIVHGFGDFSDGRLVTRVKSEGLKMYDGMRGTIAIDGDGGQSEPSLGVQLHAYENVALGNAWQFAALTPA